LELYDAQLAGSELIAAMQVRVVKSRGDQPLSTLEGAGAIAALTAGYPLLDGKEVKNFEDYVEDTPEGVVRETIWAFDDTKPADFAGQPWPLQAFLEKFHDSAWCSENADHPIAYLRHQHDNVMKFRDHFRKHKPMILLRRGQRTLKIRPDLTEEEKAKWLKLL
jgi:hypothetical protein